MHVDTNSKTTGHYSSTHHNKEIFNAGSSFEERLLKNEEELLPVGNSTLMKTIKVQEEKCSKIMRTIRRREKMRAKVEKYLSKKMEEERRRVKIMIQVLNDISKNFPFMLFHSNLRNKI